MAMGPEFITGIEAALKRDIEAEREKILRINKIEGGDCWTALKIYNKWLLISWAGGAVGCCNVFDNEINALKNNSRLTAPIVSALKSRFASAAKGEIIDITQINHDRVLEFKMRRRVAAGIFVYYYLILEATEPIGNLLLLNSERIIEEAARHSAPDQNSYRTILPGHKYAPPPIFDGILLDKNTKLDFQDVLNIAGIGRPLAKIIQAHWEDFSPEIWRDKIINNFLNNNDANFMILNKNYLTKFSVLFPETKILNLENKDILSAARHGMINILLHRGRDRITREIKAEIKRAVKSRERRRDGLLKQLKECQEAEIFRRKGEMILAHIYEIPARAENITLTDWNGDKLNIELDPNLTPSRNAERYFKKYKKFSADPQAIRDKIFAVESAIAEINEQPSILENIDDEAKFNDAVRDLKEWLFPQVLSDFSDKNKNKAKNFKNKNKNKINKILPPHLEFKFNNNDFGENEIIVLVGLSARGNRYVTFKEARPNDIWLHAHELPGAHVIIKGADRSELESELDEDEKYNKILKFAASLAAWYSKGKNSNSVLVDYTERRHVRAVPGTVALVTYTEPGTMRVTPENKDTEF